MKDVEFNELQIDELPDDLWVCLGTFYDESCFNKAWNMYVLNSIRVERDDPSAQYRIYQNIKDSLSDGMKVDIDKCTEFENHNKIIEVQLSNEFMKNAVPRHYGKNIEFELIMAEARRKLLELFSNNDQNTIVKPFCKKRFIKNKQYT